MHPNASPPPPPSSSSSIKLPAFSASPSFVLDSPPYYIRQKEGEGWHPEAQSRGSHEAGEQRRDCQRLRTLTPLAILPFVAFDSWPSRADHSTGLEMESIVLSCSGTPPAFLLYSLRKFVHGIHIPRKLWLQRTEVVVGSVGGTFRVGRCAPSCARDELGDSTTSSAV